MAQWHLNSDGDPGVCKATQGKCPFGKHFDDVDSARKGFEEAATFERKERSENDKELAMEALEDLIYMNEAIDDGMKAEIGGEARPHLDVFRYPEHANGNSKEIAAFVNYFTDEEDRRADGYQTYEIVAHAPTGALLKEHHANTVDYAGEKYVIDYGFAEVDPNADWPYVGKLEEWRKEVDRASVLGAPEKEPDPIDPRSLSVAVYPAGGPNPLLEKAMMEEEITHYNNGTKTRFLSVDQVRVAAVHYKIEDDGLPHLHSIETRQEYRHQGYMKKLLKELASHHGVDQVYSSGSMTNDGYAFTSHLTKNREGQESKVNWAEYGEAGAGTFNFVHNWMTGTTSS